MTNTSTASTVPASSGTAESTSDSQDAVTPATLEPTLTVESQVPDIGQTPTPVLESEREAVISYIFALNRISDEYEESLSNAGVTVSVIGDDRDRAIAIYGSLNRVQLVVNGLSDRLETLEPSTLSNELLAIHVQATKIVTHEVLWLNQYAAAIESGDETTANELLRSYYLDIPVNQIADLHEQLQDLLAVQNIRYGEVFYRPDDFRLTILDEDYLPKKDQRQWLQQNAAEYELVQDAIDRMKAENSLDATTIAASYAATSDFSAFDFDNTAGGTANLFPGYLPYNPTVCAYEWNVEGQVVGQYCSQ
jgi:hypothetical protein